MKDVITIPARGDNYIYVWEYQSGRALVVDPCDADSVKKVTEKYNLQLDTILTTHHHMDHTAGIKELKNTTNCKVFAPANGKTTPVDQTALDSDEIEITDHSILTISTPGHTENSVCYYLPGYDDQSGILFSGDTLFVGGCGRVFTGNTKTMWNSLLKLVQLPEDTLVYCGHNYTIENYRFAMSILGDNQQIDQALKQVTRNQRPSVPSTIAQEKSTNIFLMADNKEVKQALNMPNAEPAEVFTELRNRKDTF